MPFTLQANLEEINMIKHQIIQNQRMNSEWVVKLFFSSVNKSEFPSTKLVEFYVSDKTGLEEFYFF